MSVNDYQDINAKTIDRWVEDGWEWGTPISHEEYISATKGSWNMFLTPTKSVPHKWFGEIKGKKVLGLASAGGQQMPIFAALGADCTVLDYSQKQLEKEILVSKREGYKIRIIRADMSKKLPFDNETFDLIFHPVSNCYRILKSRGLLLAGFDLFTNYIVDDKEEGIIFSLPFDPLSNPKQMKFLQDRDDGIQFSHSLEEQIGGQLEAGFTLLDLYEDTYGEGRLHKMNIPTYLATRSMK